MYFGNIADDELQFYYQTIRNNFSLSLVDVLSSDLFKVETIINNKLYRIYPLFYCDSISSTNLNDEIMGNKCIICAKDTDTRLYFNNNNNNNNNIGCSTLIYIQGDEIVTVAPIFVCFNTETRARVEGVKITADLIRDNVHYCDEAYSNKDGIAYLPNIFYHSNTQGFLYGKITMEYDGETTTLWEETQ